MLKIAEIYFKIFPGFFIIFLLIGGLGVESIWLPWGACVFLSLTLIILFYIQGSLVFPKFIKFYFGFILILVLTLFYSLDIISSLKYILLFLSGGELWLLISNVKTAKYLNLANILIFTTFVFSIYFLILNILNLQKMTSFGLVGYSSFNYNHHHLGDLWGAALIPVIYGLLFKKKQSLLWIALMFMGVIIMYLSKSRSSYFSLGIALAYLYSKINILKFKNLAFYLTIALLCFFVVTVAGQKSLILSRPYFFESINGLIKFPFGVGLGNFGIISGKFKDYSSVTHNLILEFVSGIGVFALIYVYWLYLVIRKVLQKQKGTDLNNSKLLAAAIFISLTINFMFNYTYFVPTMLWLWFFALAVAVELD